MGDYFNQIPLNIQEHIQDITKTSGLADSEESLEKISQAWIEKKDVFEQRISSLSMNELERFEKDDIRGILVLTYSGSLLTVGPIELGGRKIEYASVGIRADVPAHAKGDNVNLADDIEVNKEVTFKTGPIKSTSLVYKIAVCKEILTVEEQLKTLKNATIALEKEFTNINKTVILD